MRILLVEDDQKIASFIIKGLKQAGLAVDYAAGGEKGLNKALTGDYDVAVIDIMLPVLDGLSLIHEVRQQKINTPVIVLSAKRFVDDRVRGLQIGEMITLPNPLPFLSFWPGCRR
jgi:two-component system OmpR family response regulator